LSTYRELFHTIAADLGTIYDKQEAENIAEEVLFFYTKKTKLQRVINNELVSEEVKKNIAEQTQRLLNHEPLQYVLGECYFYKQILKVNPAVLIPRPETAELVEEILLQQEAKENIAVLDIGTGSGCIPIALSCEKKSWQIEACDISLKALETAKNNAVLNNAGVNFFELDILSPPNISNLYDIIISNPPYILADEAAQMNENVLRYEPHLALFVNDNDPLEFYKAIIQFCTTNLKPNGFIYFECNTVYTSEVMNILAEHGFVNIEMKKDLQGLPRMVWAQKNH
jgi:release factor glutamine methyltransferase